MLKSLISTLYPKKWISENLIFVIFILIITTILIIRALPDNHMDADAAQAVMAARWWARDGFLNHNLLMFASGYGKIVKYFDEPQLQAQANGIASSGMSIIGNRIYYTHQSGFPLIPIALLLKLGITKPFFLKLFAILASILGLIFFYKFVQLISSRFVAFVAVFYFGISGVFLHWAESLDRYPLDDFWRFLILFLSVFAFQKISSWRNDPLQKRKIKIYLAIIWFAYLFLANTSFKSIFFIFAWLLGLSAIYIWQSQRKHRVWSFIFWGFLIGLAPIISFTIQFIQNASYLGWHDAWLDIYGTFIGIGNRLSLDPKTRIEGLIRPFFSMTGILNFYTTLLPLGIASIKKIFLKSNIQLIYLVPFLIPLIGIAVYRIRKYIGSYPIPTKFIIFLAIAPMAQTFVLPFTGYADTMGRLTAPFIGLVLGIILEMLWRIYKERFKDMKFKEKIVPVTTFIFISFLFAAQITTAVFYPNWPAYKSLSDKEIAFTQKIKNVAIGEKAVFMINKRDTEVSEDALILRGQAALINPKHYFWDYHIWEYYFDMPLLNFTKTDYLIRDLTYLEKRAEFPFTAIVTSDDENLINKLHQKLKPQSPLLAIEKMEDHYYFIVPPVGKKDSL